MSETPALNFAILKMRNTRTIRMMRTTCPIDSRASHAPTHQGVSPSPRADVTGVNPDPGANAAEVITHLKHPSF
jgi:hypothetical protein